MAMWRVLAVAALPAAAAGLPSPAALRGAVTRAASPVEVVLAHYKEDLSWTEQYGSPDVRFTVYSKGARPPRGALRLPNVGREGHTYLHHIVHRYDSLAPWTVFSQAVAPSWGFQGGNALSGHLTDNVQFEDYLRPHPEGQDAFFVFSAATHFPTGLQSGRVGMLFRGLKSQSKSACPVAGAEGWGPWWYDPTHPHVTAANPSFLEFYHRFVAGDGGSQQPVTMAFPQGARFAVSRERIHTRPREYYARLLEQVSRSSNPIEGYWLEVAWFDVFHPEALQTNGAACELPPVPRVTDALANGQAWLTAARKLQASGELRTLKADGFGSGYTGRQLRLEDVGAGYIFSLPDEVTLAGVAGFVDKESSRRPPTAEGGAPAAMFV